MPRHRHLRAKAVPSGYYIDCPYCNEPVPVPDNGSHTWDPRDDRLDGKHTLAHYACGNTVTLPRVK